MLAGAMWVWFTLTGASLVFVIWDSLTNGVTSWVQRIAWILVTFYTGPVGLFFYLLACRRPFPGGHEAYTRPLWKQAVNSEMHCLAGDATGVIVAASIVPLLGLSNGWDVTIEYLTGFVSGLFVFQALMMRGMYGGDYFKAVRKTIFAETVSMNMVMTGMIPVMVILEAFWPGSGNPADPSFWFRMGLASIVGGVVAFPINRWLVANHLKHGCMTLPGADGPAPQLGHSATGMDTAPAGMKAAPAMTMPGHAGMAMDMPMSKDNAMGTMPGMHMHMHMRELPLPTSLAWVLGTYALLFAVLFLTAQWVPITFR